MKDGGPVFGSEGSEGGGKRASWAWKRVSWAWRWGRREEERVVVVVGGGCGRVCALSGLAFSSCYNLIDNVQDILLSARLVYLLRIQHPRYITRNTTTTTDCSNPQSIYILHSKCTQHTQTYSNHVKPPSSSLSLLPHRCRGLATLISHRHRYLFIIIATSSSLSLLPSPALHPPPPSSHR